MRLICKNNCNEIIAEVYLEEGKGIIDGDIEEFDEVYIHDRKAKKTVWLDEREHMDTTYIDLYHYALDYLQAESLNVEEA